MLWAALLAQAMAFEPMINEAGSDVRWARMPVTYAINPDNAPDELDDVATVDAIVAAFEAWAEVPAAELWFERLGNTASTTVENDSRNLVYWESDWEWDPNIVALTSTWSTPQGTLLGFDIRINATAEEDGTPRWTEDNMDLQNAMTHEVGHAIGLDHSPDEFMATMFASTISGERTKRDLHWDDEEGVRYLYSEREDLLTALSCSSTGKGWGLAPLLLTMGLFTRRTGKVTR